MKLQDLLQERAKIAHDMRELNANAEKEDRGLSTDESQKWDRMCEKLDELDGRIEREKKVSSLAGLNESDIEELRSKGQINTGENQSQSDPKADYEAAFRSFMRSTEPGLSGMTREQKETLKRSYKADEARAQGKGTASAGGYLVPEDFVNLLTKTQIKFGGIEQFATVFNTENGRDIPLPTNDDTANDGSILAENTADGEQDTTFGEVIMKAYKYTSDIIKVSYELLEDEAFNLEAFLAEIMGERIGRAKAADFAAGDNSSKPQGLNGATSGVTAAATGAVTYDELLDLRHSVDPVYQVTGRWVMNDATFLAIKKLQDSDGRKLWQPDVAQSVPATLDGRPYVIDQGLPNMAANAKPIVFGDLSGYAVRNVRGVMMNRLVERYADAFQVGFMAWQRADGRILNAGKLRAMTMAAA